MASSLGSKSFQAPIWPSVSLPYLCNKNNSTHYLIGCSEDKCYRFQVGIDDVSSSCMITSMMVKDSIMPVGAIYN